LLRASWKAPPVSAHGASGVAASSLCRTSGSLAAEISAAQSSGDFLLNIIAYTLIRIPKLITA
jgi:hypothetical protein